VEDVDHGTESMPVLVSREQDRPLHDVAGTQNAHHPTRGGVRSARCPLVEEEVRENHHCHAIADANHFQDLHRTLSIQAGSAASGISRGVLSSASSKTRK
jgi:hypothetical protein